VKISVNQFFTPSSPESLELYEFRLLETTPHKAFKRFIIPAKALHRTVKRAKAEPAPHLMRESRIPGENRDPILKMVPDFRRDGVWIPIYTGMADEGAFQSAQVILGL
jgi:hypothetical protein